MSDEAFLHTEHRNRVAVVWLDRPEVLNALSPPMLVALADALERLDRDPEVLAIVITGGERVFAAGADLHAMAEASPVDILAADTLASWQRISRLNKPLIAAVNGYALGGGCELAMSCDLIIAGENARFGQPEIKVGIMPGAGGTQRLARAIGPYRAMEMVLTGEPISAQEAFAAGLVNRVVPPERTLEEALSLAQLIAERPPIAVRLARQALRHGVENTLREGMAVERRNFTLLFDTEDQAEGMKAFLEKRPPEFKGA